MDLTWMRKRPRTCPKTCEIDGLLEWAKIVGVGLLILTGVLVFCLGFSSLIIGSLHFDECEFEPMLPIFLVVDGCLAVSIVVAMLVFGCPERDRDVKKRKSRFVMCGGAIEATIGVLLLAWLVVGTLWLFEVTEMAESTGTTKIITSQMTSNMTTLSLNMTVTSSDQAILTSNLTEMTPNGTAVTSDMTTMTFNVTNIVKTCSKELIDLSRVVVVIQWILFAVVFIALFITLVAVCLVFIDVWKLPDQRTPKLDDL